MSSIKAIPAEQAQGRVLEQYTAALGNNGYIPNYLQAFSLRPEVYDAWGTLLGAVRGKMRLRRYELVTLAAAMALGCTY